MHLTSIRSVLIGKTILLILTLMDLLNTFSRGNSFL
ncbi:hypothetical protein Patl1_29592 [Pistacia atlantica]|uniref:Uncharacterized protein n=1 Tax=Pistacia atlantica TaxID=434234 RepID=A0ACC1A8V7_9ROSI|nr:hypothetical protein Patl1_29592 [Pistacia atlantica]